MAGNNSGSRGGRALTPSDARMGWSGREEAKRAWEAIGEQFASFFIAAQTESTNGKRVVLWEASKLANGGRHFPTLRQQVGSCVGHGGANACWYLSAWEVVRLNDRERVIMPVEPYAYGIMRMEGGFRISGDGGVGSWMALATTKYGVLRSDLEGGPTWDERSGELGTTVSWSGELDRQWGRRPGPPAELVDAGRQHLVRTVAKVTSYEQVRDALANGYPVTVASSQGFQMRPRVDRGKHWGVPSGTWMHQMCFIGVDDDSARPGCYCLNSWGADAHGRPADDAPPGGFWVDAETVTRMARQDDTFAWSQFDGFPEQELDFNLI